MFGNEQPISGHDHHMKPNRESPSRDTRERKTERDPMRFVLDDRPEPAYRSLFRSGELEARRDRALAALESCRLCPRSCGANRSERGGTLNRGGTFLSEGSGTTASSAPSLDQRGNAPFCGAGRYARVTSAGPHLGEERCIRGRRGSGTIFFSSCNLQCVFCQNSDISRHCDGEEVNPAELARMMLGLADQGCHNVNLVTPSHLVPQILEGSYLAAEAGLDLPVVYNSSGYDSMEALALLDGVVDIYMPDLKYLDEKLAARHLKAADYPKVARRALREMHRQVGALRFTPDGVAVRGMLVRHLVMPGAGADTRRALEFLSREVSPDTYVNLMGQYYPSGDVTPARYPELCRRPDGSEMEAAYGAAAEAGLWRLDAPRFAW